MADEYIKVVVPLPFYNTFIYKVPKNLIPFITNGKRVIIPFGNRSVTGYIWGKGEYTSCYKIKAVLDIIDENPLFPENMIPFFQWIADYYMYPIGGVVKNALPVGINLYDVTKISITKKGSKSLLEDNLSYLEKSVLDLLKTKSLSLKSICKKLNKNITFSFIKKIENIGLVTIKKKIKEGAAKPKRVKYITLSERFYNNDKLSAKRDLAINIVKQHGSISLKDLSKVVSPSVIKGLEEKGYLKFFLKDIYRDPFGQDVESDTLPCLTKEQQDVITKILDVIDKGFSTWLLSGVTGSGKTEVYMRLVEMVIKKDLTALILVPEISLISQTEMRFRARFGNLVAILHSGLSVGERYDQWMRIINKKVSVVIGVRSAIFVPINNLGIIIVDEEHDASYKQDSGFCYNARDLAIVRAKMNNIIAILGSATPSVQSYYNVEIGKFNKVSLKQRINNKPLPDIKIVDLKKYKDSRGVERFITPILAQEIQKTLDRNEQIIIFLNRRGFASFALCGKCGEPVKCKNCDISLTFHQEANICKCHFCGFTQNSSILCKKCGSSEIRFLGFGTEKIESVMKKMFPFAKIARIDHDTTRHKGSIVKILKDLKDGNTDILIGTQMVAKGHDFPNVTLVGIICADLSLNFPDFRSGERTFQLLAQVAGRAGRGKHEGQVIMQTYNPDHFSILAAKDQNFHSFYNQEIEFRKNLEYPPVSKMVLLKISGKDQEKTKKYADSIGQLCYFTQKDNLLFNKHIMILGPIESPFTKIENKYRYQIIVKSRQAYLLHFFVKNIVFTQSVKSKNIKIAVDVDPYFMM